MDFGKSFKFYRQKANLTQKEAAEKIGIKNYQLGNYETNRSQPSLEILKKMSKVYSVSIDKMLKLPGNSDRVIVALQKYKLRRIESVMSLAIRAGIKENYSDLEFLRNALKETAESSNVILSKKEMANYMIFSSCPYQTIKAIDKMKSVIKGFIRKTYYSLFKRA